MKKLLNINDIVTILGLSKSGVYRLVQTRRIPFIKISGKAVRFRQDDIEQWLLSKTCSPCAEHNSRPAGAVTSLKQRRLTNSHINRIIDSAKKSILKEVKHV
jgi:excisionase family DNA binding protein